MFLQAANFPIEAIRTQIAEALDIVIHLGKVHNLGRRVLEIAEVVGVREGEVILNPLFRFDMTSGLESTGNPLVGHQKLRFHGEELS